VVSVSFFTTLNLNYGIHSVALLELIPNGYAGTVGGFQGTTRYFWSSEISGSQGIWSSRPASICSYLVINQCARLLTSCLDLLGIHHVLHLSNYVKRP
jgi:hypothetical protein